MTEHTLYLGYWYQRTSLHLSEVYDFLRNGTSPLHLDKSKLHHLRNALNIKVVTFKMDVLEYIELETTDGIRIKYYEDGLVILTLSFDNIHKAKIELSQYYEQKFTPAISYIFSLGAPIPKELEKTKQAYPYFLVTKHAERKTVLALLKELGEEEYFEMQNNAVEIYRGDTHFVINTTGNFKGADHLIEMLIFFSEFKGQLHRYLNLHRSVWEKIEHIKEQGTISGKAVSKQRSELESYKKTIELIAGRMEQMDLYIETRESIVKNNNWEAFLTKVLAFKYENLRHSHDYVKSLWKMTKEYVDDAIQVFNEVHQESTKNSVTALTIVSSIGVVGVILTHLAKTEYPTISFVGLFYLVLLITIALLINRVINYFFKSAKYKIHDVEYKKSLE